MGKRTETQQLPKTAVVLQKPHTCTAARETRQCGDPPCTLPRHRNHTRRVYTCHVRNAQRRVRKPRVLREQPPLAIARHAARAVQPARFKSRAQKRAPKASCSSQHVKAAAATQQPAQTHATSTHAMTHAAAAEYSSHIAYGEDGPGHLTLAEWQQHLTRSDATLSFGDADSAPPSDASTLSFECTPSEEAAKVLRRGYGSRHRCARSPSAVPAAEPSAVPAAEPSAIPPAVPSIGYEPHQPDQAWEPERPRQYGPVAYSADSCDSTVSSTCIEDSTYWRAAQRRQYEENLASYARQFPDSAAGLVRTVYLDDDTDAVSIRTLGAESLEAEPEAESLACEEFSAIVAGVEIRSFSSQRTLAWVSKHGGYPA